MKDDIKRKYENMSKETQERITNIRQIGAGMPIRYRPPNRDWEYGMVRGKPELIEEGIYGFTVHNEISPPDGHMMIELHAITGEDGNILDLGHQSVSSPGTYLKYEMERASEDEIHGKQFSYPFMLEPIGQ